MHSPVLVDCPANVWTLVASSISTGQVHIKDANPGGYLQTYRPYGVAGPTDEAEGVKIDTASIPIFSTFPIDVYIMALGQDGVIRLDRSE